MVNQEKPKTLDEALADVRESMRALCDAYMTQQMDTAEEARYDAHWFAGKCAEYWRKEKEARDER